MVRNVFIHIRQVLADVVGAVINHVSPGWRGKDVGGAVENAGVGKVEKHTTMITKDSGVERFTALADNMRE